VQLQPEPAGLEDFDLYTATDPTARATPSAVKSPFARAAALSGTGPGSCAIAASLARAAYFGHAPRREVAAAPETDFTRRDHSWRPWRGRFGSRPGP
jgi:hypothetical protein